MSSPAMLDAAGVFEDETHLISSDSKFRNYAVAMDKALKGFEGTGEWADLINSLVKIQKVLQSNGGKYSIIPRKALLAKRLSQVLHPALPPGVHLKSLEIYHTIFGIIKTRGLSDDLFLYSSGLFPLMGTCSMATKPKLLELYEKFYVPLGNSLQPAMSALIHGLLPGLEEGSDYYSGTFRLLEQFKKHVSSFNVALWESILGNHSTRFQGLTFAAEVASKNSVQSCFLTGPDSHFMVSALCECLQDSNVLVQRVSLDLLISLSPPTASTNLDKKSLILLTSSALNVLLRKDLSLNRRLYTWILGPKNQMLDQDLFLDSLRSLILMSKAMCITKNSINRNIMLRPLRIVNILMDKEEIGPVIIERTLLTLFRYLFDTTHKILGVGYDGLAEKTSNQRGQMYLNHKSTGDLVRSTNVLFQDLNKRRPDLLWDYFVYQFELCCGGNVGTGYTNVIGFAFPPISISELCCFISFFMDIISLFQHQENFEDAFDRHIPTLLTRITELLRVNCKSLALGEIGQCLRLSTKLVDRVHPTACYISFLSNHPSSDSLDENTEADVALIEDGFVFPDQVNSLEGPPASGLSREASARPMSIVQTCINTFKSFLHQFVVDKVFGGNAASLEPYRNNLFRRFASVEQFSKELEKRLKDILLHHNSGNRTESEVDNPLENVFVEDEEDFLDTFNLCCQLIHAYCTLPVHKQNDTESDLEDEGPDQTTLPQWLEALVVCGAYAQNFSVQAQAIDCVLQQLALSSTQSSFELSDNQAIIPSIPAPQLRVLMTSYNVFLEFALSLWHWLDSCSALCHERSVDLWFTLHGLSPVADLCENVIVNFLQSPQSGLEACRRFGAIWHLTRAFSQSGGITTAGHRSFDKSLLVMMDGLFTEDSLRRAVVEQWLVQSIKRGDIGRLLEPLLIILLHKRTCRVVASTVPDSSRNHPSYAAVAAATAQSSPRTRVGSMALADSPDTAALSKSALGGFLTEMEKEMTIDSEEFDEVDPTVLAAELVIQLLDSVWAELDQREYKGASGDARDTLGVTPDQLQLPEVHFNAGTSPPGSLSPAAIRRSCSQLDGANSSSASSDLRVSDDLLLQLGARPDLKSEVNIDHLLPRGGDYVQLSDISSVDVPPLATYSLSNFFLAYKQLFDGDRVLHAFSCLIAILQVEPKVFISAISSTNIGSGNTPYVYQVQNLIARHKNSILGLDFYADVDPQQLVSFRNAMYIEILVSICLYYLRSFFRRRDQSASSEDDSKNYLIQIKASQFLTLLFGGLNDLVTSGGHNFSLFVNDLMFRCKVQKTVLLCLLFYVRQGISEDTRRSVEGSIDTNSHMRTLETNLINLVSVLVRTEFSVFVSQKRKDAEEEDYLYVELPPSSDQQKLSNRTFTRYNSEELIVCQSFFINTLLEALKQYDSLQLHSSWLNFTMQIAPFCSKALKDVAVPTVNQICRNLEILCDIDAINNNNILYLPPDFVIILLDALSSIFLFCTIEKGTREPGLPQPQSPTKDKPEEPRSWSSVPTSQQSQTPAELSPAMRNQFWLDAKKGLLDILPRVLSAVLTVWKCAEGKSGGTKKSAASTHILGQPPIIRQHLIEFLTPVVLSHCSKLFAAIALVWNGRRDPQKNRKLNESCTADQLLFVSLIKAVPALSFETVAHGVIQVLKSSPHQLKKQPVLEVSTLQFFYAYIRGLPVVELDNNWGLIQATIRDSVPSTSHGGQVVLLLIANYVINRISLDTRDTKEFQETVCRVIEAVTMLACTGGLIQSAWIGKLYVVRPGPQVPMKEDDLLLYGSSEAEQTKALANVLTASNNSIQALENVSDICANLLDYVYRSEEKEKIIPVTQNILFISMPFLKTRIPENVPSFRAASAVLASITNYPYTRKAWKKETFDLFLEKSFFVMTPECIPYWRLIIDNLMTHDKVTFKEFLGQNSVSGIGSHIIKTREVEIDQKSRLLKRLAFVVFSSERDQYSRILPELQERVSDALKLGPSPVLSESIFLLFRILLLRLNTDALISLWPVMISELANQLKQLEFDLMVEAGHISLSKVNGSNVSAAAVVSHPMNAAWLAMYLSVCKFLDTALLICRMSLSHFQAYTWAFVGAKTDEHSTASFVPYCARVSRLLEERVQKKQRTIDRLPVLHGYPSVSYRFYSIDNISDLQPFFTSICNNHLVYPANLLEEELREKPVFSPQKDHIKSLYDLHLTHSTSAEDFLERLLERDFAELLSDNS